MRFREMDKILKADGWYEVKRLALIININIR